MKISKNFIVIVGLVLVAIGIMFFFGRTPDMETADLSEVEEQVYVRVKGGYYPDEVTIDSKKKTSIVFVTEDTYDCSSSVSIPELGIEEILPPTGKTEVLLPSKESGVVFSGGCSSSIYDLTIRYE